jgi:hypothetical protein
MSSKGVAEVNSSAGNEDVKFSNGGNSAKTLVNIGSVTGVKHSKEGDTEGFLCFKIVGKNLIDVGIFRIRGMLNKSEQRMEKIGSGNPLPLPILHLGDNNASNLYY